MQPDWEVWLDTNISPAIAKWMANYTGLTVKSAYILSLHQLSDLEVYSKAKASGKVIIISKDADFPELISRLGSPPLWNFLTQHIQDAISILANSDIDIVELD